MKEPKAQLVVAYFVVGLLLSQIGHGCAYEIPKLKTWFQDFGVNTSWPSIQQANILYIALAVVWYAYGLHFWATTKKLSLIETLRLGFTFGIVVVVSSQLVSSSVMRIIDETAIFILFLAHIFVFRSFLIHLTPKTLTDDKIYDELWHILRIVIPIAVALPAIIAGAGLVTSFYKDETVILRKQLYRQFAVALYLEFGILLLLIWPTLKAVITIRENTLPAQLRRKRRSKKQAL